MLKLLQHLLIQKNSRITLLLYNKITDCTLAFFLVHFQFGSVQVPTKHLNNEGNCRNKNEKRTQNMYTRIYNKRLSLQLFSHRHNSTSVNINYSKTAGKHYAESGMPDRSTEEGCNARILTSYFRLFDSLTEDESEPSDTSG